MSTKLELLAIYRTAINRVQFAYACLVLWSYPDAPVIFEAMHAEMSDDLKPFPAVVDLLHDQQSMKIVCEQLYELAYRSALNELFPLTKTYCYETNQLALLKSQSWFSFWRILRNCWSHDMKFNFNPAEHALLPIKWSGVTIDASMNGRPITNGQFPRAKVLELVEAIRTFIEREVA